MKRVAALEVITQRRSPGFPDPGQLVLRSLEELTHDEIIQIVCLRKRTIARYPPLYPGQVPQGMRTMSQMDNGQQTQYAQQRPDALLQILARRAAASALSLLSLRLAGRSPQPIVRDHQHRVVSASPGKVPGTPGSIALAQYHDVKHKEGNRGETGG